MCGHVGPVPLAMLPGAIVWVSDLHIPKYVHARANTRPGAHARLHNDVNPIRGVIWCQTSTGTPIYKRRWSRVFLDIW